MEETIMNRRIFVTEAIPEEVMAIVNSFQTKNETRVPSPLADTGRIIMATPATHDLRTGDVVYFQRRGPFAHQTGWDRVTIGQKWPNVMLIRRTNVTFDR